jgi:hypothetical protein
MRDCISYVSANLETDEFPALPDVCSSVTWKEAHQALGDADTLGTTNDWGSCINTTVVGDYMLVTTNNVPDYYHNPYVGARARAKRARRRRGC